MSNKLKVTVILTTVLPEWWGMDDMEEEEPLTEEVVLELIKEDMGAIIDDGKWSVIIERPETKK